MYPRRSGNLVTPWIDGVPFYERLLAAIRGAQARVWAIVSFIEPSFRFPDGTAWWDLLDECGARGLDVRILFWRNPSFFNTRSIRPAAIRRIRSVQRSRSNSGATITPTRKTSSKKKNTPAGHPGAFWSRGDI